MLLEGQVGYLIGGLRQMLTKHRGSLRKAQRETLGKVIHDYETNDEWMRDDQYIAFEDDGLASKEIALALAMYSNRAS